MRESRCSPGDLGQEPTTSLIALIPIIAVLASLMTASPAVAASTLYVGACGSPTYADIESAVDAAVANETIHVCAGGYALSSTVVVTKDLTFAGDGAPITTISGGGNVRLSTVAHMRSR